MNTQNHANQVSNQSGSNYNQDFKNDEQRRRELADFLRTRRERLKPTPDKCMQLSRRRTPGLRREEVAELAGVGATWYTWLEQARDIQPSSEVLGRIGKALELNPFEIKHLFTLAGKVAPSDESEVQEQVPLAVKRMIDETMRVPVLVLGERLDHLYWNPQFNYFLRELRPETEQSQNWMELIFCDPRVRKNLVGWESHAKRIIAEFRAAIGEQVGSPWVVELIERLKAQSPEFGMWWKSHDVRDRVSLSFEIDHEEMGRIAFERTIYAPVDAPKLKLVIFTPLTASVLAAIEKKDFRAK